MLHRPASAGRPRFDIADIVRQHRAVLEAEQHLTTAQRRVLSAIELCRTATLGGHLDVCRSCGYEHPAYNSCRNRHCPKCQLLAQEKWIGARSERLLPVRHFHVVFTVPSELRPLARSLARSLRSEGRFRCPVSRGSGDAPRARPLGRSAARGSAPSSASRWCSTPGRATSASTRTCTRS